MQDWGIVPDNENDRNKMVEIIKTIFNDCDEVRIGDWRMQPDEVLFFIKGEDVVITNADYELITILKGGKSNARVKNSRKR